MKKIVMLLSLVFLTFKGYGQDALNPPLIDDVVTYSETINSDLNKDKLYGNLKAWLASNFSSDKVAIDLDDLANGKVIVRLGLTRSFESLTMTRSSDLKYYLQVDIKDQKYRYILKLTDHYHKQTSQTVPELIEIANGRKKTMTNTSPYAKKQVQLISDTSNEIIQSLKEKIEFVDDF
ncbi:DUF4468 domain-containing protein [Sphingobacterium sp.]|uniref:DUF4468 domain-containing protein n=1 Tax=Sphingobacterium sp. TaxID=341027 RepID=UPI0028AB1A2B|nr:DUF4468 domain-containing protein [Sphingobacterium sp.]